MQPQVLRQYNYEFVNHEGRVAQAWGIAFSPHTKTDVPFHNHY